MSAFDPLRTLSAAANLASLVRGLPKKRRAVLALIGGVITASALFARGSKKLPSRYPPLSRELRQQLMAVEESGRLYRPCMVALKDGSSMDRVYVVDAKPWFRQWGVWPEDDSGKISLDVRSVARIGDSPSRLPAKFANQIYNAGESGMGYTIFTVQFRDGTSMAVGTGDAVDFIDYPEGQSPQTVVGVLPHVGRGDPKLRSGPDYRWCLFDGFADDS
jgi:hypothetical protein